MLARTEFFVWWGFGGRGGEPSGETGVWKSIDPVTETAEKSHSPLDDIRTDLRELNRAVLKLSMEMESTSHLKLKEISLYDLWQTSEIHNELCKERERAHERAKQKI